MGPEHTENQQYMPATMLTIVSANVRGFHTNFGELTHNVINRNRAYIVFVCETFLDGSVTQNYGRVRGYSTWTRKDRSTQGGGVAFCYKENLNIQVLEPSVPVPRDSKLLGLEVGEKNGQNILCSSDHMAVLTKVHFRKPREESHTRVLWT
ncbi:hypothetical protein E2C01_047145 [Portunus trituberculatus]|uniref:Uncharacterized protein n=1 Tax=Portunus trituberculatus TaxID=210409 RepID=A0A5B7G6Z0_PORTR|nr:hypothetical protein [Portunus trituberculatus]